MDEKKEISQGIFLGLLIVILCLTAYSMGEKHGAIKVEKYEQSQSARQDFVVETMKLETAGDDPDFKTGKKYEAVALNSVSANSKQGFNAKITTGKYLGAMLDGEAVVDPMGMVLIRFTKITINDSTFKIRALGVLKTDNKNQEISFSFNSLPLNTGTKITILML